MFGGNFAAIEKHDPNLWEWFGSIAFTDTYIDIKYVLIYNISESYVYILKSNKIILVLIQCV